jgi:outer membrane immunogenic protein
MLSVLTATAASLALGVGGTAMADGYDAGSKGFVAPPAYSWSGVYMGVHGGYGWGDSDIDEQPLQFLNFIPASLSSSHDIDGGLGGVQLGMNKQFGNWVVGGEFRLSGAEISGSTNDCGGITSLIGAPAIVTFNCDTNVNWVAAALARLGYAQNRWLVYGTLGWAVAGVSYSSSIDINLPLGPGIAINLPSGENDTADGFAFGGGVEYAFTESVSFGVEYTRMELESEGSGLFLGGILSSGDREIELNTVTARLNVKWGGL